MPRALSAATRRWYPYAEADLFDIHYVQSADVLTLVHPNYAPRELRRFGATDWMLIEINFTPKIDPPESIFVTSHGNTTNKYNYFYVVTSVDAAGVNESRPSQEAGTSGNLFETGATITIGWNPLDGVARYNVYKKQGGLFGFIGQTAGTSIVDDNIAPDLSKTPPIYDTVFQPNGIVSVPVLAGGSGYNTLTTGGNITSVYTLNQGSGYTNPTMTVSDPTGSGATFEVLTNNGAIAMVVVLTEGLGYTNPTLILQDPTGSGAEFKPIVMPVTNHIFSEQQQTGKKLTPAEIQQKVTRMFAQDLTLKGWLWDTSKQLMSMKAGDIPSSDLDAIKKSLARQGIANPSNDQLIRAYWVGKNVR